MTNKTKKIKSHSKPSIKKSEYKETMDNLGIDLSYGDIQRPKPIPVFRIKCFYKKFLDRSRFPWSREYKYSENMYNSREVVFKVINKLQSLYPKWYFSATLDFIDPNKAKIINKPNIPIQILLDLDKEEANILSRFTKDRKEKTTEHEAKLKEETDIKVNKVVKKTKKRK